MFLLQAVAAAAVVLGAGPDPAPEPPGADIPPPVGRSGNAALEAVAPRALRPARPLSVDAGVRRLDWSEFEQGACAEAHLGARWRPAPGVALSAAFRTRRGSLLAPDDAGAFAGVTLSF